MTGLRINRVTNFIAWLGSAQRIVLSYGTCVIAKQGCYYYYRLSVFENRVLRGIFGPKRYGVTGEWRKLHNEELNDLYSSPNIVRLIKSRRMRWAGHMTSMEEGRGVYKVLVGKPDGKRPLGRPRRR